MREYRAKHISSQLCVFAPLRLCVKITKSLNTEAQRHYGTEVKGRKSGDWI